jgi:predicted CopG family antitoxin
MDDTEKLSQMMIRCGLATGHGDTIDDLIFELEKQIKNTSHAFSDALKKIAQLREALAEITNIVNPQYYGAEIQEIAREKLKEKE